MTITGLKAVVISHHILICVFLVGVLTLPCAAHEVIGPDRDIVLGLSDRTISWKILWDEARLHVRTEQYTQAALKYSELFLQKPNIEQANWEYCKVLQKVGDYRTGAKIVASLLEKNPDRIEYIVVGGQFAADGEDWELAAKYFGKVLEKDPLGQHSEIALEGLRESVKHTGRKEIAFPLTEHLALRQKENIALRQEMAVEAFSMGDLQKTRLLLKSLMDKKEVDTGILLNLAEVFDAPGYEKEQASLLRQYLKKNPGYHPFRKKLIDLYTKKGDYAAVLGHLVYLIDHLDDNAVYLLQAGTVNLFQLGRPDKALSFFERYSEKKPDDQQIKNQIRNIQHVLANDFLSIVENDGAWLLWRDLARITPNRLAIYLQMADLLEKKKMFSELLEILAIIHQHHPEDDSITLRLAQTYFANKMYAQALDCLVEGRESASKSKELNILRAKVELELGRENDAFASYEAALKVDDRDMELRTVCIKMAGSLGYVEKMKAFFTNAEKLSDHLPGHELILTYLEQLAQNYIFYEYERVKNRYRPEFLQDKKFLKKIDLHYATVLRREGKTRAAEQLLRQSLQDKRAMNEVLAMLIENALNDKNISAAKTWFALYEKIIDSGRQRGEFKKDGLLRILFKSRIARAKGDYSAAIELLEGFPKAIDNHQQSNELITLQAEIKKELCWLLYHQGNYRTSLDLVEKYVSDEVFNPEIFTLRALLSRKMKSNRNGQRHNEIYASDDLHRTSRVLAIVESDIRFQEFESAERRLQVVLREHPDSVLARILWANLLLARGKFAEAERPLEKLHKLYPEEPYFSKKLVEVQSRQGNYNKALTIFRERNGEAVNIDDLQERTSLADNVEESLVLARLLWGAKDHDRALMIYRKILAPSVHELLKDSFRQNKLNHLTVHQDKNIWDSMMLLLQSEQDIIAELMEPSFLVNNLTNEAGSIVAGYYELYSWQKMINTEYLARNAIHERNYHLAEQNYKRLIEEQKTAEGLVDLATVYGRIGKFRKEAQLYEEIQTAGTTSPALETSIKRSSLQFSPQSIFEITYSDLEGRNGFVDMASIRYGTSFWVTQDLNKDFRFSYTRNRYESDKSAELADSSMFYGITIFEFARDFEMILGGGAEKIDSSSNTRFLYEAGLKGQLDENFHTFIKWEKKLVYDTVAAIEEGISKQEIEAGLFCETPFGLTFGGDFSHRNYNDQNSRNRFHCYSSYGYYGESIDLSLRYDYQYFVNTETNPKRDDSLETMGRDVTFYWSPASYFENMVTLHFQQDFLGYVLGEKQGVSYYSIDNIIGYEDSETLTYTGRFDIFLEMNPSFLLKGNFTFAKSDNLEEKGLSLSLHYRW